MQPVGYLQNSAQLGNRVFASPNGLLMLMAAVSTTSIYCTFQTMFGSDYVVPASKTLYIRAVRVTVLTASTAGSLSIGYANTGTGGDFASGAPTTPIYATNTDNLVQAYASMPTNVVGSYEVNFAGNLLAIPTGKYPFIRSNVNTLVGGVIFFCEEV